MAAIKDDDLTRFQTDLHKFTEEWFKKIQANGNAGQLPDQLKLMEQLQTENKKLKTENGKLKQVEKRNERVEELKNTVSQLREQLNAYKDGWGGAGSKGNRNKPGESADSVPNADQSKLLKDKDAEIKRLRADLAGFKEESNYWRQEHNKLKRRDTKDRKDELGPSRKELKAVRNELRQARHEMTAIDKRVDTQQFKINCLRCEMTGEAPPENQPLLRNALIDGEAEELRQLKHQLKQSNDELSNSRQTVNKASKDIKERDQEISKLRGQLAKLSVNPPSRSESRNSTTRKQERSLPRDTNSVKSAPQSAPTDDASPSKQTPKKHNRVFTPTNSGRKLYGKDVRASPGKLEADNEAKYARSNRANNKSRSRRNKRDRFENSEIMVPQVSVNLQMDDAIIDVGRIVVNVPTPSSTAQQVKSGEQPKLPSWNDLSTTNQSNGTTSNKSATASKPRLPLVSYRPEFKGSSDASTTLPSTR